MLKGAGTRGVPEIPAGSSFSNTYSMAFDGVDQSIDLGITNSGANDVSVSCWIKTTETHTISEKRCAFGGRNNGSGTNYGIGTLGSAFGSADDMKVRIFNTFGSTKINDGDWHNIIYTHNYTTKETKAYVDGNTTPEITTTLPAWSTFFRIFIGWNGFDTGFYFDGNIDECSYYTSVLGTSDVTTIYNSGVPGDLTSLSPIGWWRMGDNASWDGSNWTLTDQGSGGNDGTSDNSVEADRKSDVPS